LEKHSAQPTEDATKLSFSDENTYDESWDDTDSITSSSTVPIEHFDEKDRLHLDHSMYNTLERIIVHKVFSHQLNHTSPTKILMYNQVQTYVLYLQTNILTMLLIKLGKSLKFYQGILNQSIVHLFCQDGVLHLKDVSLIKVLQKFSNRNWMKS
jgi:hypothetical protein